MSIPSFALKRPVCIFICILALAVFGVGSVTGMPMESTPEMNMPVLMVMTRYSGASPEEVDEMVTDVVESALSGVTEVESMTSTSSEGSSMVMLEFSYSVDIDDKYQDVASALSMLRLPDDAGDPTIMEMSMNQDSIMSLSVKTAASDNAMAYVEDEVVPRLERVEGVAEVSTSGGSRKYVQILLKEEQMKQYGLTMSAVANTIASAEFETTLGDIKRGNIALSMVGSAEYSTYRSLEQIPISLNTGDIIHLEDVAEVNLVTENQESFSRSNGEDSINISISKNQSANTIGVCDAVAAVVEEMNADNTLGLNIEVRSNSGETIMESIQSVLSALLMGMAVALAVLFLFFGELKASAIVALSMPLSVFAALVMMAAFDMTINMMSLGGLVVGIGMLVDNSIVVIDSCFRCKAAKPTFRESVAAGANLVGSSVLASTITTVVVFLPISLMDGMAGQLFQDVGFTIMFSLSASVLSALSVVPLLFFKLRPAERRDFVVNRYVTRLERVYARFLRKTLGARAAVVGVAVLMLAAAAVLFTQIDMELMPMMDRGNVNISIETKTGLTAEAVNEISSEIEAIVSAEPDVEKYSLRVSGGGGGMMGGGGGGSGSLSITLKGERSMSTDEFVQSMREKLSDIENCHVDVSQQSAMSFGGSSVEVQLTGNNLAVLEEAANTVREALTAMDGADYVSTSLTDGSPRAVITVDPVLSGAMGMTPQTVLASAKNKLGGITAMTLRQDSTEYSVVVEYPPDRFEDVSDLYGLMVDTSGGGEIPLTDLAEISYAVSPSQISRQDGDYVVTVSVTPETGRSASQMTSQAMSIAGGLDLPEGVELAEGSDMRTMNSEFGAIGNALLVAVFLVFGVMAVQFESLRFSLVVLISVPFSLTGAFLALYLTGSSISMTSLIGLVMLVGVVVNNAIVLIDYTAVLRREERLPVREALVQAGQTRLRPILMSTLTTVVGLIPMAVGFGGKVEMMQGMAVVVIGGLSLSTLLTLVLIPTFYLIFDPEDRADRRAERLKRKEETPVP